MYLYAVINQSNVVINIILWDGVAQWNPPIGCIAIKSDVARLWDIYDPKTELFASPVTEGGIL